MDFLGNSGLVCQTDRLEDKQQSELEGLGKKKILEALFGKSKNGFCRQLTIYVDSLLQAEKYCFRIILVYYHAVF